MTTCTLRTLVLAVFAVAAAQATTAAERVSELLEAKSREMTRSVVDLTAIRNLSSGLDAEIANHLVSVALVNSDRLSVVAELSHILESMVDERDRAIVRPILETRLEHYLEMFDIDGEYVGRELASAEKASRAEARGSLREKLRDASTLLTAIRARMRRPGAQPLGPRK